MKRVCYKLTIYAWHSPSSPPLSHPSSEADCIFFNFIITFWGSRAQCHHFFYFRLVLVRSLFKFCFPFALLALFLLCSYVASVNRAISIFFSLHNHYPFLLRTSRVFVNLFTQNAVAIVWPNPRQTKRHIKKHPQRAKTNKVGINLIFFAEYKFGFKFKRNE